MITQVGRYSRLWEAAALISNRATAGDTTFTDSCIVTERFRVVWPGDGLRPYSVVM